MYDGSSCPSENGSSSDCGRLDSDDDVDYPRRVLDRGDVVDSSISNGFWAPDCDSASPLPSFSGDGGIHRLGEHSPATEEECANFSSSHTVVELRSAEVFAWDPERADGGAT